LVGSRNFLQVLNITQLASLALDHTARGETVIWIGQAETLAGYIALCDSPHPSARLLIQQLEADHLQTVMLSGDSETIKAIIAQEIEMPTQQGDCPQ
jgi:P-type E1-E2 ATPase